MSKSNGGLGDVSHIFPTDCVLCDNSAETNEEHEQHMEEVHDA